MECTVCGAEMNLEEVEFSGLSVDESYSETAWLCPECDEVEPYVNEEESDQESYIL